MYIWQAKALLVDRDKQLYRKPEHHDLQDLHVLASIASKAYMRNIANHMQDQGIWDERSAAHAAVGEALHRAPVVNLGAAESASYPHIAITPTNRNQAHGFSSGVKDTETTPNAGPGGPGIQFSSEDEEEQRNFNNESDGSDESQGGQALPAGCLLTPDRTPERSVRKNLGRHRAQSCAGNPPSKLGLSAALNRPRAVSATVRLAAQRAQERRVGFSPGSPGRKAMGSSTISQLAQNLSDLQKATLLDRFTNRSSGQPDAPSCLGNTCPQGQEVEAERETATDLCTGDTEAKSAQNPGAAGTSRLGLFQLPPTNVNYERLFSVLKPEIVVAVFESLLCEHGVVFVATAPGVLMDVCEALISLIYPFQCVSRKRRVFLHARFANKKGCAAAITFRRCCGLRRLCIRWNHIYIPLMPKTLNLFNVLLAPLVRRMVFAPSSVLSNQRSQGVSLFVSIGRSHRTSRSPYS